MKRPCRSSDFAHRGINIQQHNNLIMLPEVPSDNWKDKYFQMKQIKIMVAFAFLSVVLSAGCKKDSKSDITPDAMVITTSINYKLMTEPQNPSSFLIWNSGYITTSALDRKSVV